MRLWHILAFLMLITTMLPGCGGAEGAPSSDTSSGSESDIVASGTDEGLDDAVQLALGTLALEETEHAVTPDQAETLLPLWRALQGGVTAEDEIAAVLKGIEGAMSQDQLAVIADLELTQEDLEAWMTKEGLDARPGFAGGEGEEEGGAGRRGELGEGGMPGGGAMQPGEDMPPEMATRVAERQSMSEEEREAMRATAQPGGGPGGGVDTAAGAMGQLRFLLRPLLPMLEARAGEA